MSIFQAIGLALQQHRSKLQSNKKNLAISDSNVDVNVTSAMMYASTKSAMESLTRSWADILSQDTKTLGTTVNSLSVGGTATDALTGSAPPEMREAALRVLSEGKSVHNGVGLPDDVAKVVGLIISEAARWINGSVIAANGGSVKVL